MDVSHPETATDPQYWSASDPDDPDCLVTVGIWADSDASLVAEIVETRDWCEEASPARSRVLWHLRLAPEIDAEDSVRVARLAVSGRDAPAHDLHALRRELLQFRKVVRVIRDGGFARNPERPSPVPPTVALGDPDDAGQHALGPPPGRRRGLRRRAVQRRQAPSRDKDTPDKRRR